MNEQIWALIGAVVLAFVVKFFNVVIQWLAKVLGVNPPDPIPAGPASELVERIHHDKTPPTGTPTTDTSNG